VRETTSTSRRLPGEEETCGRKSGMVRRPCHNRGFPSQFFILFVITHRCR
jgi:hypothetical protein